VVGVIAAVTFLVLACLEPVNLGIWFIGIVGSAIVFLVWIKRNTRY